MQVGEYKSTNPPWLTGTKVTTVRSLRSSKTSHKNSSRIQPECATGKKNMFKIFQFCLEVDVTPASISALLSLLSTFQNTCLLQAIYFNTTL